ncbi:MAG: hypothetical protein KGO96_07565 [Elusimicrobia bacterium]|nr:hypothetical protein [Elusimicrobiota bacterium]
MSDNVQASEVKVPRAVERIEMLEKTLGMMREGFKFVDNEFQMLSQKVSTFEEFINAILDVNGKEFMDKVTASMLKNRENERQKRIQETKDGLAKLVEEKVLESVESIDDGTMMVVCEYNKEGKIKGIGYNSVQFDSLKPEFKDKLRGKKRSDKVDLVDGDNCEILEVYKTLKKEAEAEPNN